MTTTALHPASVSSPPRAGSLITSLWTLYALALRQYLHGKRWIVLCALALLPAGLAVLVRNTRDGIPHTAVEFIFAFMFIPQALLPLVALIYASGMIQDEQEDQTITYLLIRPIPKWALYLTKLLATLTTCILLTAVFTALTYLAIYAGSHDDAQVVIVRCVKAITVHSLAVIAYSCLFGLMAILYKRSLLLGIVYIAVFEGLFANMAFSIRLITVIYYARLIAYHILPFTFDSGMGTEDIASEAWQLDTFNDPNLTAHPTPLT
ncbi:MAG: ABC transporter permease, partial [Tepidisphaeraceae bacterium]